MWDFKLVIEGKSLQPVLRELARSDDVRVLGAHISRYFLGSRVDGTRMVLKVRADTAEAARDSIRGRLPSDGDFSVGPC